MTRLACSFPRRLLLPMLSALSCFIFAGCEKDYPTAASRAPIDLAAKPSSGDPIVSSTDPSSAPQDTTLDVAVTGSNFDVGSRVDLAIDGVTTEKVRTNSTTFVTPKKLIANITIAPDAVPDRYDVIVMTSKGKRGIGIERFEVTLRQGRTNLYSVTFGGDLEGTVTGVLVDFRDPLKQITTSGVTFRPGAATGDRSVCPRINGTPVTATDWAGFSDSGWFGSIDLARRRGGSFHLQLLGDQQDPDGGHINLVVNHTPLTDTVNLTTGVALVEFRNARALVGLASWADMDESGSPVTDDRDRCINFTITAVPSGVPPQ